MLNHKGGRGHEAPYKTVTVRIPEPIKLQVDIISSTYKELKLLGKEEELKQFIQKVENGISSSNYETSTKLPSLEEAREIASKLLKQKQSKQATIEKLIQLLYNQS